MSPGELPPVTTELDTPPADLILSTDSDRLRFRSFLIVTPPINGESNLDAGSSKDNSDPVTDKERDKTGSPIPADEHRRPLPSDEVLLPFTLACGPTELGLVTLYPG